jgi:hypothetical protein
MGNLTAAILTLVLISPSIIVLAVIITAKYGNSGDGCALLLSGAVPSGLCNFLTARTGEAVSFRVRSNRFEHTGNRSS